MLPLILLGYIKGMPLVTEILLSGASHLHIHLSSVYAGLSSSGGVPTEGEPVGQTAPTPHQAASVSVKHLASSTALLLGSLVPSRATQCHLAGWLSTQPSWMA